MARENYHDLLAFLAVARERSFTRAAAQLGVSPSALSHTVRALETRLGIRLLTRTTRSVSPTEAGERLLQSIAPRFEEIDAELAAIGELRDTPSGTVRITTTDYAIRTLLWPKLSKVLHDYPDVKVEFVTDYGLTDIVAERYDIGVRLGDTLAKDMIAARIAPDLRMVIVGAPAYLKRHPAPKTPQDLTAHRCINLRLPTRGGVYAWSSRRASARSRCAWTDSSPSTASTRSSTRRCPATGWPTCPKTWPSRTWRRAASSGCWKTGSRPSPAITSTTRAAGSRRARSRW